MWVKGPRGPTQVPMIATDYITLDEIRQRAHSLWERDGRPEGRANDHWHTAERQLQAESDAKHPPEYTPTPPAIH